MVLEIINSTITYSLHHNPNLVYTLLYKRETFDPFRSHPMFQDVIQNVDLVLGYFSKRYGLKIIVFIKHEHCHSDQMSSP